MKDIYVLDSYVFGRLQSAVKLFKRKYDKGSYINKYCVVNYMMYLKCGNCSSNVCVMYSMSSFLSHIVR